MQSLDTVGAVAGRGIDAAVAEQFLGSILGHHDTGRTFGLLSAMGVQEPPPQNVTIRTNPTKRANLKRLGTEYWRILVIGTAFTLARSSEAFLSLRAAKWYCYRAGVLAGGGNECGLCSFRLSLWQIV